MKKLLMISLACFFASYLTFAQEKINIKNDTLPTALLVIDIQDFYFPGGKLPLAEPEEASARAAGVEKLFRDQHLPVIMIQHAGGSPVHKDVVALPGEKVITKKEANSFSGTDLLSYLESLKIKRLVICGMQTQMCVEATTRAAYDYGFKCIVVQDACAARSLKYGDRTVSAADVHASTLASLNGYYAKVVNSKELE
jgi:nicotinamidase-related amidase